MKIDFHSSCTELLRFGIHGDQRIKPTEFDEPLFSSSINVSLTLNFLVNCINSYYIDGHKIAMLHKG